MPGCDGCTQLTAVQGALGSGTVTLAAFLFKETRVGHKVEKNESKKFRDKFSHIVKAYFKFIIFLPLTPHCWDFR